MKPIHYLSGILIAFLCLVPFTVSAQKKNLPQVKVFDPFIELHSGPGKKFSVIYTAEQNEWITLLKQRTAWVKVRLQNGKTGWVFEQNLKNTLTKSGNHLKFITITDKEYLHHQWEMGIGGGQYSRNEALHANMGYHFNRYISTEVMASQIFTASATNYLFRGRVALAPFPNRKFSPFFSLGAGRMFINTNTTVIANADKTNDTAFSSIGLRNYLGSQFMLQFEYLRNTLFTTDNDNREIDEWLIAVKVFF